MGYLNKAMVAITALICLACSAVFMGVVWHLIVDPPEIQFTRIMEDCVQWEGLGCTWEVMIQDGEMERISLRPWPLLRSLI